MIPRILLRSSLLIFHRTYCISTRSPSHSLRAYASVLHKPIAIRSYVTKTPIDEKIEEIQELYATAKDEFELASEETEKKTVYAADDRAAAQEELAKLKEAFERAVGEEGGDEIKRRVGNRVRELESAVKAMEERAMED
ncbi:hypothetical protein N7G274_008975 [Stereocaulon virgatum]|uniref:Uncharacterized protein n=1 Tax=Stereocaulon virgatum TaxID=373712 RepID=A0ABR4A010_9LECA